MADNLNDKLNNGYPFRDDIFNFTVVYNKKKFFFEFPLLIDRTIVVGMNNCKHIYDFSRRFFTEMDLGNLKIFIV